jgi:hypothetical protein
VEFCLLEAALAYHATCIPRGRFRAADSTAAASPLLDPPLLDLLLHRPRCSRPVGDLAEWIRMESQNHPTRYSLVSWSTMLANRMEAREAFAVLAAST